MNFGLELSRTAQLENNIELSSLSCLLFILYFISDGKNSFEFAFIDILKNFFFNIFSY